MSTALIEYESRFGSSNSIHASGLVGIIPNIVTSNALVFSSKFFLDAQLPTKIAAAKLMNTRASFAQSEEPDNILSPTKLRDHLPYNDRSLFQSTAPAIRYAMPEGNSGRTKYLLMQQLLENEFKPISYDMVDSAGVVEFLTHPSRLVCIFDSDSIQLMWTQDLVPKSLVIRNAYINVEKLSQDIALILNRGLDSTVPSQRKQGRKWLKFLSM
ncbi:MAG: hypothetical protein V4488_19760 [Pseudomonadota bacterium]